MIEILSAICLGPLDAFRGGQLSKLSHRLPSKTPTALYGAGVASTLGLSALSADFWLVVIAWILGEATGWTVALSSACGNKEYAATAWSEKSSWWEDLLPRKVLMDLPAIAMFVRGLIWALPLLVIGVLIPEALVAAAAITIAVTIAPFIGRKGGWETCWHRQEWIRGWITGAVILGVTL